MSDKINTTEGSGPKRPLHGPAGDARPDPDAPDPTASPSQPPEKVEDRPAVSQVSPDDYPEKASGKNV